MMYIDQHCPFVFKVDRVDRVVDGDTVDVVIDLGFSILTKQRVRLLGIDAPENRTRDQTEKVYGKLATEALSDWFVSEPVAIELRCLSMDDRGKFGRILGELWVRPTESGDWVNLNKWMVNSHHAIPYDESLSSLECEKIHAQNREQLQR